MAWLETDRHGRLRIAFKYYDGRTYREPLGVEAGLHPNFPPVISRVRRLFRLSWGVLFVALVSSSSQFFRPPFTL